MRGSSLLIRNACIVTGNGPVHPNGSLLIRDGVVEAISDSSDMPQSTDARVIDASGRYVLPGFINPHMHLYGALACGMNAPRMRSFGEVLKNLWWKLDRALTLEDVYVSALLGGIESLRAGVTTVFDHHASYGAIAGSLSSISEALGEVGLRACLCFEISDRNGKKARDMAIDESASWLNFVRTKASKTSSFMQRGMVGLHASMTLTDSTQSVAKELMDRYGATAHVHVAEGAEDVDISRRKFGLSPVARLTKAGILKEGTIAAHCVHVDDKDISLLSRQSVCIAHNPLSNLNNSVGIAPVLAMLRKGALVAIGTDGMSASLSADYKLASVIHKLLAGNVQAGWDEMRYMVWEAAPWIASSCFGYTVGSLRKGAAADVIILDTVPATPLTRENALSHLLFRILNARVQTAIVGGRIRMQDYKILGIDESEIAHRARKLAKALWRRM